MRVPTPESHAAGVRAARKRYLGAYVFYGLVLALLALGIYEAVAQRREARYVRLTAEAAAKGARAGDELSVVVALRDYVRRHVSHHDYSADDRPFLRSTAEEVLRSGKGHCGEATRAFVNMADAFGIRAQRLYLEGRQPHVVAEVTLKDGGRLIVDAYDEPYVWELETLDAVLRRPLFDYYSTFNLRVGRLMIPHVKADLGPLAYYLENPHAMKALLCFALAAVAVVFRRLRVPLLNYLRRRRAQAREAV